MSMSVYETLRAAILLLVFAVYCAVIVSATCVIQGPRKTERELDYCF